MLCDHVRGPEHWAMRGPVASGFPAALRRARRARLESRPFVGRRDRRVIPGARGPGSVARTEARGSRGVCGGGDLGLRPGADDGKAAAGSLPPFSRPWLRRRDMRSAPRPPSTYRFLAGGWGRSVRCPGGTVDRLAKDQEAGPGLGWGEAAKQCPGHGGRGGCSGRHSGVGSQPAAAY